MIHLKRFGYGLLWFGASAAIIASIVGLLRLAPYIVITVILSGVCYLVGTIINDMRNG
jgi:hypothetical protein